MVTQDRLETPWPHESTLQLTHVIEYAMELEETCRGLYREVDQLRARIKSLTGVEV